MRKWRTVRSLAQGQKAAQYMSQALIPGVPVLNIVQ